jgi:hypothetical protein
MAMAAGDNDDTAVMSAAKREALRSIRHAITQAKEPEPLGGLELCLVVAALEHAHEKVMAIPELKRAKKAAATGVAEA